MEKHADVIEIDLLRLLKAIFRKIWIVVLAAILCAAIGFSYASFYLTPTYSASAMMYVNNTSSYSIGGASLSISPSELSAAQNLVDTYLVILKTRTTMNEVIEVADLDYTYEELNSMVSATAVNETEIFRINVVSTDPEEARLIVNTIADVLPDRISGIVEGSSVKVVDYAVTPTHKVSPSITKYTAIGLFAGAVLSGAVIILLELMDDFIHSADMLPGNGTIPVLAEIPNLGTSSKSHKYYSYSKSYGKSYGKGTGTYGGKAK